MHCQRIGAGTDEGLDAQALFDRPEEDLDVPAFPVNGRERGRAQRQVIGQQHDLLALGVTRHDAAQEDRTAYLGT